jgi:hypothetical protein
MAGPLPATRSTSTKTKVVAATLNTFPENARMCDEEKRGHLCPNANSTGDPACYRRLQDAVNGNEVITFPLPSTKVAMPSMLRSFKEALRVMGPV